MRPGLVIDWLWGGLNYQIEHHLFPTMPRHNLKKVQDFKLGILICGLDDLIGEVILLSSNIAPWVCIF